MAKKENLPLTVDVNDMEPSSSITYASEVVAIIAGIAASEVEGVAAMVSLPNASNLLGKNRSVTKGVKVEVGTEEVSVDLYMVIEYGQPIQKVAQDAQENVRRAIESMTGLHVVRVDVHVQAVSFEKENSALSAGAKNAMLETGVQEQPVEEEAAEAEAPVAAIPAAPVEAPAVQEPVRVTPAPVVEVEPVAPVQDGGSGMMMM